MKILAPLALAVTLTASLAKPPPQGNADPVVTSVALPDQGSAGETFLTRSSDGSTLLSWVEQTDGEARMVFYAWKNGAWSTPKEIARGANWFVNWADVPSIAAHPNGTMMAHWLERLGDARYAYGVRVARSTDGGNTWSEPEWLHADRSPTEHGFARIEPYQDGFLAVWLDGSGYATERREMSVHARTIDAHGSFGPERAVDTRACDCCPTELVVLPGGKAGTIYRDRSGEEQRAMSISVFDGDDWTAPSSLNEDGWMINACPVNGPAADVSGDAVAAAWFTMPSGQPEVWARVLDADDLTHAGEPVRVDVARPAGRVAVRMVSPDEAMVLWMEGGEAGAAGLYLRRVYRDGTMSDAHRIVANSTGRAVGYPRLERLEDDWLVTWTEPGETREDPNRLRAARVAWPSS